MDNDKFEQLAKDWPYLFQKSKDFEFSINDGWYNIIDTLCGLISYRVENSAKCLAYELAKEHPDQSIVEKWQQRLGSDIEELPIIVQVKEKFGSLRFYVDGGTNEIAHYIDFAEAMSHNICEVCGSPGERRNTGWVKTLCEAHHRERENHRKV